MQSYKEKELAPPALTVTRMDTSSDTASSRTSSKAKVISQEAISSKDAAIREDLDLGNKDKPDLVQNPKPKHPQRPTPSDVKLSYEEARNYKSSLRPKESTEKKQFNRRFWKDVQNLTFSSETRKIIKMLLDSGYAFENFGKMKNEWDIAVCSFTEVMRLFEEAGMRESHFLTFLDFLKSKFHGCAAWWHSMAFVNKRPQLTHTVPFRIYYESSGVLYTPMVPGSEEEYTVSFYALDAFGGITKFLEDSIQLINFEEACATSPGLEHLPLLVIPANAQRVVIAYDATDLFSTGTLFSRGTIWMVQWWHLTVSNARRKECAGAYQCLRPFPLHLRITRLTPLRLQLQLVRFHHLLEVHKVLIMLHFLLLWCWTIHQTTRSVLRHGLNITSWS